jgi:signal transduction histidine kinase/cell division protein FtsL
MNISPNRSFPVRLALTMVLLIFLTTSSILVVNYQIERRILIEQIRERAVLMAKALQFNLSQLILHSSQNDLAVIPDVERQEIRDFIQHFGEEEAQFDIYARQEGVHDLFFVDAGGGKVTIDYPAEKEGRILPAEERLTAPELSRLEHNEILSQIRSRGSDSILLLTFPVLRQNKPLGFGRVEMSMNSALTLLSQIKFWGAVTAVALFLIAVVLATYLAGSVTRPIFELVNAAGRFGAGDHTVRLIESSKDEIGILKKAFNRMVEDIVHAEEAQKRVERLEVAGQLAARMAHEIKNPLNSIGLIIDYQKDRFLPSQEADQKKFRELSDNIKTELARLNEIVESFLRFAKPTIASKRPIEIPALIEDTLSFISPEAVRQSVSVRSHVPAGLPQVAGDYSQLRQALLNLFINAFQAMPEGGKIDVNVISSSGGEIEIAVQDSGCGVPQENLSRLFDPYFTTKVRGFGLGLSIVERIVQEHGGVIAVVSQQGKGTAFTIKLPACSTREDIEVCTT